MNSLFNLVDDMVEVSINRKDNLDTESAVNELNEYIDNLYPQHYVESIDKPYTFAYFMSNYFDEISQLINDDMQYNYTVIDTIKNNIFVDNGEEVQ